MGAGYRKGGGLWVFSNWLLSLQSTLRLSLSYNSSHLHFMYLDRKQNYNKVNCVIVQIVFKKKERKRKCATWSDSFYILNIYWIFTKHSRTHYFVRFAIFLAIARSTSVMWWLSENYCFINALWFKSEHTIFNSLCTFSYWSTIS